MSMQWLLIGATCFLAQPTQLNEAEVSFGLKYMSLLARQQAGKNICISPFSIQAAGSMLRGGASGATDRELDRVLEHGGHPVRELADDFQRMGPNMASLAKRNGLLVANGLWSDNPLMPEFIQMASTKFGAVAVRTKFPQPGLDQVNQWVSQKTNKRIPKIFEQLDRDTEVVLANAVWFKDDWVIPFDPKRTQPRTFWVTLDKGVEKPTMSARLEFRYAKESGLQICEIPMRNATFLIGLPESDVAGALSSPAWRSALSGKMATRPKHAEVRIPKFVLESNFDLLQAWRDMGMSNACSSKANFTKLSSIPTFVGQARHRTFFMIDESGVEAAAATAISNTRGAPPEPFVVDRPFLFAVKSDDTLLFTGIVCNPTSK